MEEQADSGPGGPGAQGRRRTRRSTWRNSEALRRLAYVAERASGDATTPWSSAPGRTAWWPPTCWPTAAGRCWCSRPSPTSAAPSAATEDVAPGLRARHVQRVLPAGRRVADDPVAAAWRSTGCAGGTRRRCSATPLPDGDWALLHRDRERDRRPASNAHRPGRRRRVARALRGLGPDRRAAPARPALAVPPVRAGLGRLARLPQRRAGSGSCATLLTPAADLARERFAGDAPALLLAGNAGHADIPLDAPGSGLMARADVDARPDGRLPGAGGRSRACSRRPWPAASTALGGEIRCRHRGRRRRGRAAAGRPAYAPRTASGSPPAGPWSPTSPHRQPVRRPGRAGRPPRADRRRACAASSCDPATVKVDWALDGPVPWADAAALRTPARVHVADSVEEMTEAHGAGRRRAGAGRPVPARRADDARPTRPGPPPAPSRCGPTPTSRSRADLGDAGDGGIRGDWDHDDCERFADRMQERFERLAPGLRLAGPRPAGARAARAGGPQRQPGRRRDQRRHRPAAPAAGLPAGARPRPRRDRHRRALPRLGVRPPRRRRPRRVRARTPPAPLCCTSA